MTHWFGYTIVGLVVGMEVLGGFFIRRSFRGSGLYPIVFMKYVDVMMNRGHPIEFFIEGGRSRTGRLLIPGLPDPGPPCLNPFRRAPTMHRTFTFRFFFFPRPLAEGSD